MARRRSGGVLEVLYDGRVLHNWPGCTTAHRTRASRAQQPLLPEAPSACGKEPWTAVLAMILRARRLQLPQYEALHHQSPSGPVTPVSINLHDERRADALSPSVPPSPARCRKRAGDTGKPHSSPGGRVRCERVRHPGEQRVSHAADCGAWWPPARRAAHIHPQAYHKPGNRPAL